jgi:acyl dehydratase
VLELRPSRSKPDRGLVVIRTTTLNQNDEPVQQMTGTLLVLRSDAVVRPVHSAA